MKHLITGLFAFLFFTSFAQEIPEKKITTQVNEATVFLDGAQISRTKKVQVSKGTSLIIFTGLSPFINPKSIQVKANGNVMVLSVDHRQNFLNKSEKPKKIQELIKRYSVLEDKIDEEKARLSIIDEEIDLLNQNKKVGGENKGLTVNDLRAVADYYSAKMTDLKIKRLHLKKKLIKLRRQQDTIKKQAEKIASTKVYPTGEINVKVSAKQPTTATFTLLYNVKNAGWFPSYDIRSEGVNTDLQLVYKANISQNTQVDWNKVKLSFSSSNPEISGEVPQLIPYRLGYYTDAPTYNPQSKEVTGIVKDAATGDPLPGVNIILKGTSIGTATDFDGKYNIMVPDFQGTLVFSFIGYETKEVRLKGNNVINVNLKESSNVLDAVVITSINDDNEESIDDEGSGLGFNNNKQEITNPMGMEVKKIKTKAIPKSIAIPLERVEKQMAVNFSINKPYSVKSGNKISTVELTQYSIPADYEYLLVPKITRNAYLISYIKDWEKYNLLSGEANVFMEGTAIGKTLLDTGLANDTLQVSLGVDKGIVVNRELGKEYSGKKLIGTKKTDTREWKITVKNNKNQPVQVKLIDQVPVSATSEVEVEIDELSKGKLNKETGEVQWKFKLSPGEKKEFVLRYKVKYSRYRNLRVE